MSPRIAPATAPFAPLAQEMFARLPREWGSPLMIFTVLARDPRLLERQIRGAVGYLNPSHITIRQREVFLLRVMALCRCEYEWGLRVHFFAQAAALSEEQIRSTVAGHPAPAHWTDEDHCLLSLAEELDTTCTISDGLWKELKRFLSDEAILQLLMLAGAYRGVAYLANGLRFPLETSRGLPFPADARRAVPAI
jgi:alkylhydroperoxidase family enzyme